MCLFLCQHHTVLITIALEKKLRSQMVRPPAFLLLFKTALAILSFFGGGRGSYAARTVLSRLVQNCVGILMVGTLNLYIGFWRRAIVIISVLPILEHAGTFHFLIYSSISFVSVLRIFII